MNRFISWGILVLISSVMVFPLTVNSAESESVKWQYFGGQGDSEYLDLLDISYRMFTPDPDYQNWSMLYTPVWNGLVEGPTWNAWWIQNSYGTTYCALPFLQEPFITFLQNSQDLWFDQMGDGKTVRKHREFDWIPPDGCLCDAASPGWFVAKQGDGRVDIHDWGMEFTAAGLLMQSELLLISRDRNAIDHYLSKLERCANFIETRRDPENNLFLAGPAGNLLAPSYAGYKKADGTFDKAYLAGLSITYIAALDRLIELEKMSDRPDKVQLYTERRELAKKGLPLLTTDEGYFIKSLDPDGAKHGVFGAEKYGYFNASPNHDAIAFRVVDDAQAMKIYQKIASIPGLRPYDFIIANYPGLDDMYIDPTGNWLWSFGTWVNGGHWSTCEARMIMGYYRLEQFEDARRSMKHLLTFARQFRMDNPLVEFGSKVYQPKEKINLCYDSFGPPAAMLRGLFEYIYTADSLKLIPHIPSKIEWFTQNFPVRFGEKKLYLSVLGQGVIESVDINGESWDLFDERSVSLPYERVPTEAKITIKKAKPCKRIVQISGGDHIGNPPRKKFYKLTNFYQNLIKAGIEETYLAEHCRLVLECERASRRLDLSWIPKDSLDAAKQSYIDTADRVYDGLIGVLNSYADSDDSQKKEILKIWQNSSDR